MSGPSPAAPKSRWKTALTNSALVVCSLLVSYAILEVVFFRLFLPHLPLGHRIYLPDRADFFLQVSKSSYVPQDYVALVGDSYAQGMGDWLLSQGVKSALPHHSADVIHQAIGRDVASFGRAAAGSAEAMVLRITRILGDRYCYLFPAIERPKQFLIYFYEGNDLEDNLRTLQHYIRPRGPDLRAAVDAFINNEYGAVSQWRCHGHLGDMIWKMIQFHVRYGLSPDAKYDVPPAPAINRILINGIPTGAPELGAGSMAMTDAQIDIGVMIYDRSLAWFRRAYPTVPMTVVYLPSPGVVYRYEGPDVISGGFYDPAAQRKIGSPQLTIARTPFAATAIYAKSQSICEKIRAASLAQGAAFIDTRPALRQAASRAPLHGPRDWGHFNEAGYRALGKLVVDRINEPARDNCDDRWER